MMSRKVFILSPASTSGRRGALLLGDAAQFDLARRLRAEENVALAEVFSFLSGLYFRGKFAYAERFAEPPAGVHAHFVITSCAGLMPSTAPIGRKHLEHFARVNIDNDEPRYTRPLRESVASLRSQLTEDCNVVLLGSIASNKYVDILSEAFGERLVFPSDFIGRGDMSRGGLLLRAVAAETELTYQSIGQTANRRGKRPPRLAPVRSAAAG